MKRGCDMGCTEDVDGGSGDGAGGAEEEGEEGELHGCLGEKSG